MKSFLILLCACLMHQAAAQAIEPKMVQIPAGKIDTFTCPGNEDKCTFRQYVQGLAPVAAFELGATEVTFAEWDACVSDAGCSLPTPKWERARPAEPPCLAGAPVCHYPSDESWGRGKRPVINVSWDDVQQYLAWLNAKTGKRYRLPTSTEWEYAAFAGALTVYPWGEKVGGGMARCRECGGKWDGEQSVPVASYPPNKFGLYDMIGNVQEFVSTCFSQRYEPEKCETYIYRGGAWNDDASFDARYYKDQSARLRKDHIGFRLAR